MAAFTTLILGSNKGNRFSLLERAICCIEKEIGIIHKTSSIYESEAWGYDDKTSYYNQVVCVSTDLNPESLLAVCLKIESLLGRSRSGNGYESRTMDIDILFYKDEIIKIKELIIPHEHIASRKFVLIPLAEIMPDYEHPVFKNSINDLLEKCEDKGWVRLLT